MTYIHVTGGYELSNIAERVGHWCIKHFNLEWQGITIYLKLVRYQDGDCWGSCVEHEIKEHTYEIEVAICQSLRDFIATIVHEMVHVKQYETNKWKGDGEKECERLQYKLTDKLWEENVI